MEAKLRVTVLVLSVVMQWKVLRANFFFCHICRTTVCWDPEILLQWQRDVTTSPLYWCGLRRLCYHGALSIQKRFRFEISEIPRNQWNGCTDPNRTCAFQLSTCKQDTEERYQGQQFCLMERGISARPLETDKVESDQTEMDRNGGCRNNLISFL